MQPVRFEAALTYGRAPGEIEAEALIAAHGQTVRRIAWHVHSGISSAIAVEDLMQIGMVALIEAARGFEERGAAFGPYAAVRIRGAMIDHLRREARMSRAGMANRRLLAQTRRQLENRLQRRASDAELAESLGLDADAYAQLLASTIAVRQDSIDEIYHDCDIGFADLAESADSTLQAEEQRQHLAAALGQLGEREAMVLNLYFVEEMNLDEIGAVLGVGAARVCQIKRAALDRMRQLVAHLALAETGD